MFLRSLLAVTTVAAGCALAAAQVPPNPRTSGGQMPQNFAFSFDDQGGYLGVETREVTRDNYSKYGLRDVRGVAVEKVSDNSPAEAAGIRQGDVIVRLNGDEITSTRKLTRLIDEVDPDHTVRVTVLRNGSERELTATLGRRPAPAMQNGNFNFQMPQIDMGQLKNFPNLQNLQELKDLGKLQNMPDLSNIPPGEFKFELPNGQGQGWIMRSGQSRQIGVGVYALTPQLGERFGASSGVMINEVRPNSPAERAGLKAGDIVVQANGTPVRSEMDLIRAINDKDSGSVTLELVRDRSHQTITVMPETRNVNGPMLRNDDDHKTSSPWPGVRSDTDFH